MLKKRLIVMSKCASKDCGAFTLAKYCHSCFKKNEKIAAAEDSIVLAMIADLKAEFEAAKELGEEKIYLDGLEHSILFLEDRWKK
jgi:uncharacterized OB-fold protein